MFGLIVSKELREILGTPRFAATFGVVSLLVLLSFYLGGRNYQVNREQYEAAVAEDLRQMEGLTDWLQVRPSVHLPPQPLESLVAGVANDVGRSVNVTGMGTLRASGSRYNDDPVLATFRFLDLEFLFKIVLSLFAILFAFDLVSGEKERGTLRLALANAVPRDTWILGKLTGAFLGLTVPLLIPILAGCLLLLAMGIPMAGDDWLRLALVVAAGLLYVGAFLALSVLVSALTHRSSTSFLVLLVCWILAVMIVPRSAVALAARSVDVTSFDEILSQRTRLRAQLWEEDQKAIDEFLSGGEAENDPEAMRQRIGRFNEFFQDLNDKRTRKLEELGARLSEERSNGQALQERLAFGLARVSPAAAFSIASFNLAGTALAMPRHFLDQVNAYQEVYERFQKEKTGASSAGGIVIKIKTSDGPEEEEEVAIDPRELPGFEYRPPSLAEVVRGAALDLGLLAFFNLFFFTASFVAFLRYDVR